MPDDRYRRNRADLREPDPTQAESSVPWNCSVRVSRGRPRGALPVGSRRPHRPRSPRRHRGEASRGEVIRWRSVPRSYDSHRAATIAPDAPAIQVAEVAAYAQVETPIVQAPSPRRGATRTAAPRDLAELEALEARAVTKASEVRHDRYAPCARTPAGW